MSVRLALDTSTPIASVALLVDGAIFERAEKVTTYSERLMTLVDELFVEAGVGPTRLDAVVCGAGPGSFTGLRIGLSTAKGLCLGTGCRLVMVSSLEALAMQAPSGAVVLSGLDAFRGELYAALYEIAETGPRERMAPFSTLPGALAPSYPPTHVAGDAFEKYPAAIPAGAIVIPGPPRARELLALADLRLRAGDSDDPRSAAPSYVRASAPEEAKRASKQP